MDEEQRDYLVSMVKERLGHYSPSDLAVKLMSFEFRKTGRKMEARGALNSVRTLFDFKEGVLSYTLSNDDHPIISSYLKN